MANFKDSFIPSSVDSFDINEIYEECLYRPTSYISDTLDHTFEAINGGLTIKNVHVEDASNQDGTAINPETGEVYGDGLLTWDVGKFGAEKFKSGSFARGWSYGFNFPDRFHQSQFNVDNEELKSKYQPELMSSRVRPHQRYFTPSYSLSANVFIPFDCIVYVTFQGFFATDGLRGANDNFPGTDYDRKTYIGEYYNNRLYIDGEYSKGTEVRAPSSRKYDSSTALKTGLPYEHRWRWHHKGKLVHMTKGYHQFSVMCYPSLCVDYKAGKQQIYCGSMSLLALKSGSEFADIKDGQSLLEWYELEIGDDKPLPKTKT